MPVNDDPKNLRCEKCRTPIGFRDPHVLTEALCIWCITCAWAVEWEGCTYAVNYATARDVITRSQP